MMRRTFHAISEIRGSSCSGFNWNDDLKCIIAKKVVVNDCHPAAKGLLNRSFPHYDELSCVFRRDRTTRGCSKIFTDVMSNVPRGYDEFAARWQ
ncbi:retrotransposon protein [Cucumis melo var. makuwa]|uniref:Retrotransposon protein n=1 Tax=Cucumis melo var. makuwa TaxID=1194695 RepID=A0A5D3BBF0_CUCMM|nr:retrotransposon protein [Cucumis melo var. makuwa]TYJ95815.1 retrotransposon protein [Cucumis melo var. makuwa]